MLAIACTDAGHDLTKRPQFPWGRANTDSLPMTILPTIQYRPRCALKSRNLNTRTASSKELRSPQSLAVFPEGYGRAIDWSLASSDRFHVLAEMFRLSAFSQKQLLNLMEEKILAETNRGSLNDENPTFANLLYFQRILQGQLKNASNMLQLTKKENGLFENGHFPAGTSSVAQSEADSAVAQVHSLCIDLQSQANSLQERCTQGMTVINNKSMLAESQRAIQQAKSVTKLTLVAFVYLPFTFTCGFFGMNFRELGNGTISLWIFFAVSMPLMLVTMAVFAFDMQTIRRWFHLLHFSHQEKV